MAEGGLHLVKQSFSPGCLESWGATLTRGPSLGDLESGDLGMKVILRREPHMEQQTGCVEGTDTSGEKTFSSGSLVSRPQFGHTAASPAPLASD